MIRTVQRRFQIAQHGVDPMKLQILYHSRYSILKFRLICYGSATKSDIRSEASRAVTTGIL